MNRKAKLGFNDKELEQSAGIPIRGLFDMYWDGRNLVWAEGYQDPGDDGFPPLDAAPEYR